nr:LptF/LptG family permease [Chryseolinea sp.]
NNISIKVNKKHEDGITLGGIVVYDHRKNDGNKEVTVADSGRMYTILNERYLKFELFRGYNYTEGAASQRELTGQRGKNNETLSRTKFSKTQVVYDLSSFDFTKTDTRLFQGNRIMRNLNQLEGDMDSVRQQILSHRLGTYTSLPTYFKFYLKDQAILPEELQHYMLMQDSIRSLPYVDKSLPIADNQITTNPKPADSSRAEVEVKPTQKTTPELRKKKEIEKRRATPKVITATKSIVKARPQEIKVEKKIGHKIVLSDSAIAAKLDSTFLASPKKIILQGAATNARQVKSQITSANDNIKSYETELRVFNIQWHKILASSLACIAMFLIGAPLGAIIKRGGLGVPFLVSIVFFIIYYILSLQGEKIAKQGIIPVAYCIWAADFILFAFGLFFLRQARADARLFEADFYSVAFDKLKTWFASRKQQKTAIN